MPEDHATDVQEFSAPARVNLIGEHTDYTGGLVMPMAIPFTTTAAIRPANDGKYTFSSELFSGSRILDPEDRSGRIGDWSDYPVGVLRELQALGIEPPPFLLHIRGNIPLGSGLSSSASVEVATALALLAHSGATLPPAEIALLCQRAENRYVGSPCGIMDQFVVTAATSGHALLLHTRNLNFELLPITAGGLANCRIVVANSGKKHEIRAGDGGYPERRSQLEAGQAILLNHYPDLRDLGDATLDQLRSVEHEMQPKSFLRCRHIVSENARVRHAAEAMLAGDPVRLGEIMTAAHASERDDFECSIPEIDFLVETAVGLPGCYGARLTGGGFGGCTVNLVEASQTEVFAEALTARYRKQYGSAPGFKDAETYICEAVDGAVARAGKGKVNVLDVFLQNPHRRWNPLRRDWVVVSPHRTQRPWQGQTEEVVKPTAPQYDPACYLCPGNTRAGGHVTPAYTETFVFENDYAALKSDVKDALLDVDDAGLLRAATERGICRVLCFDPRHDLTLATMNLPAIRRVVDVWAEQEAELAARPDIGYIQIFENRGAMMGASNPHPHGQIWATEHIPNEPSLELAAQQHYFFERGTTLLGDYLALELKQQERIVAENDAWVALVPFWAVWPFELMLLPRDPVGTMRGLNEEGRTGLAAILQTVTAGYNRVFDTPFPYSMGFHPAPCDDATHPEWQLHAHFYPPLLRSATVRKFMVGFELLGSPQRDITPELAAETLRKAVATSS